MAQVNVIIGRELDSYSRSAVGVVCKGEVVGQVGLGKKVGCFSGAPDDVAS